jgi:hypothetical protein
MITDKSRYGNDAVLDVNCGDSVQVLRTEPMTLTEQEQKIVQKYLGIALLEKSYIDANGRLMVVLSDGRTLDVGSARGLPGPVPYVGPNGNWFVEGVDTLVSAQGVQGFTPYIGPNGNWFINGTDTGKKAVATDGETPYIGANGNWWAGDRDLGVQAPSDQKLSELSSRMDSFTSLPDGSTAGDAELFDARVGYNGVVYPNVGGAVRGQIGKLSEEIDAEEAARQAAITQERNRAVARENEIEELFTAPTQEAVSKWLDEHPEATTTVQDSSLTEEKFTDDLKLHTVKDYVTPQMFGAKGDGVTDDTNALNAMIQHIESLLPLTNFNVDGGAECLDWRTINVEFHGCFAISDTVSFNHSINLVIDHLTLVALPDFLVGKPMLKFGVARNFSLSNCNIDCAHNSDVALRFDDYTIGSSMANTYIHGFRKIGIECVNVGYEIKFNNIKIEQQTWEERQNNEIPSDGIGIYLSERQQDHKFCNVIINYCAEYGFKVLSGANFFVNVHVWGCGNLFLGRYNFFENCYFSETVKIGGYFTFSNTYFSFEKDVPIIEGVENSENSWTYAYSKITDSIFTSSVNITNLFKNIRADERPYMVGNTFQNVPVIVNKGIRAVYGNPYSPTIEKTFDTDDVKSINIGNMVVFYGIAETSKTVNFTYALEEVYFSSASGRAPGVTAQIWTDVRTAEIFTNGTCQWFVVGRIH